MTGKRKTLFVEAPLVAALAVAAWVVLSAGIASAKYMRDGAVQNGLTGGWVTPSDGVCVLGLHADGTMDIDSTITNKRDCDARAVTTSGTTKAQCTTLGTTGNDGAVHVWAGSSTCVTVSGSFPSTTITGTISLKDLDRTAAICNAKGGYLANDTAHVSASATGGCIAYSWQYRGQDSDGAPLAFGTQGTASGVAGFCSAYMDTGLGAASCPSTNANSSTAFGYIVNGSKCDYQFGITGNVDQNNSRGTWSNYKSISGATVTPGTAIDLSTAAFDTMGECLAAGYSWTNWIPKGPGSTTGSIGTGITTAVIFDLTKQAVDADDGCLHCHSQNGAQYNGPAERWKDSYLKTGHKNMLRKVTAGKKWAGPCAPGDTPNLDGLCVYTTDGTNAINFMTASDPFAKVTVGGVDQNLYYIYGDWMAQLPTLVYGTNGYGSAIGSNNGYSCYACHTTGASDKSNPGVQSIGTSGYAGVEPQASFPGISLNTANPQWDLNGINCSRCHNATVPTVTSAQIAASTFTTTAPTSGGMGALAAGVGRTNLCFGCHQSIASQWPAGTAQNDPTLIPTGVSHGAAAGRDFNGHVLGNSFLNSVHAQYAGAQSGNGSITKNSLGKFDLTDPSPSDANVALEYGSIFKGYTCWQSPSSTSPAKTKPDGSEIKTKADCETLYGAGSWRADTGTPGSAANTQGTCATCHDVHNSLFIDTQKEAALRKKCDDCHVNNAATFATDAAAPQVVPALINHLHTAGTPFDTNKYENACVVCHMATQAEENGNQNSMPVHVWRINTDPNYSTFPSIGQFYGGACSVHIGTVQNAPYLPVVYLSDVAASNSSCTGAGAPYSCCTGSKAGTCVDASNCTAAGGTWTPVTKDRNAQTAPIDASHTYDKAVWVDLDLACGQCHGGSFGKSYTANGAPYLSKEVLASVANGIHDGAGLAATVAFTDTVAGLVVNVTQNVICAGGCPSLNYDWDWGDGSPHGSGPTASHTYADPTGSGYCSDPAYADQTTCVNNANQWVPNAALWPITLTVTLASGGTTNSTVGVATQTVKITAPESAPSATASCSWDANSWTLSVTDTSTDADASPIATIVIDWGDLSTRTVNSTSTPPLAHQTYAHTYLKAAGPYTATLKAIDSALQMSPTPYSCAAVSPAPFEIRGIVVKSDGTTPLASAIVQVQRSTTAGSPPRTVTTTVNTTYTAGDGTFVADGLAPGSYTLVVNKPGYTFPVAGPIPLGPTSTGNTVKAN